MAPSTAPAVAPAMSAYAGDSLCTIRNAAQFPMRFHLAVPEPLTFLAAFDILTPNAEPSTSLGRPEPGRSRVIAGPSRERRRRIGRHSGARAHDCEQQ